MAQPESGIVTYADTEAAARELVACPDCTAHRGEWCRNPDGSACDQHPRRIEAAIRRAAETEQEPEA